MPNGKLNLGNNGERLLGRDGGNNGSHDHKDAIDALSGNDTVEGYDCEDHIFGSLGNDELHGGPGSDEIYGGGGDDVAFAGGQGIFLGNGDDFAEGKAGQDSLESNSFAADTDILQGLEDNNDYVYGGDTDTRDTIGGGTGSGDDCYFDFNPANGTGSGCESFIPL